MGTMKCEAKTSQLLVGRTVFEHADAMGVRLASSCGRNASCHECTVEVLSGNASLSKKGASEAFLGEGYRLSCQAEILATAVDVVIEPLRREPKILESTERRTIELDPTVVLDGDRVLLDGEEIDTFRGHLYGLAVDLGTTTVVVELVDLLTGDAVGLTSFGNPQRFGGSDVMNRISYDGGRHHGELWKAITAAINDEIDAFCEQFEFRRQEIYEIAIAGNSTMRDIVFRLDVQGIGQRPYKSTTEHAMLEGEVETTAIALSTRRVGIRVNPRARAYGLPLIASHVGADAAAALVAIDAFNSEDVFMLVDVGTNTEVVVGNKDRMIAASCPAGPAFEGGGVRYGMPGYPGAIESIHIEGDRFECRTIGNLLPQGICGSGLVDLLAELRRHGRMTEKGVFENKQYELMIAEEGGITFSREDASILAQAKAANTCGQFIAMRHFGVRPEEIACLYLAGGFANFVNAKNAIEIGFLAPVPEDRIVKIGNAALQGARETLLSQSVRRDLERDVKDIEHIELETTPDFFDVFVDGCQFKPIHFG
jgi:uncharacterized 2Fe-2S/4Fe-4S cluster protein (DUF4445 family)